MNSTELGEKLLVRNIKCLQEYSKMHDKGRFKCLSCNHIWEASWCAVCKKENPTGCPNCFSPKRGASQRGTLNNIKRILELEGYIIPDQLYKNNHSPIKVICPKGHQWVTAAMNIMAGKRCCQCANNQPLSIVKVREKLKKAGMILLSDTLDYKNRNSFLKMQCDFGHVTIRSYASAINNKCPECTKSLGETYMTLIVQRLFDRPFKKERPKWLLGLELDAFNEDLKLAFEYNGPQHYEPQRLPNFGNLSDIQARDEKKRQLCSEKGIKLITIPYQQRLNKLPNVITGLLKKENIIFNESLDLLDIEVPNNPKYDALRKLAERKGLLLLSASYLGNNTIHKFQCKKHATVIQTKPDYLKQNKSNNCRNCNPVIDRMKTLINEKGGEWPNIEEYENTNSHLTVVCANKHSFEIKAKYLVQGKWCRKCKRQRLGTNPNSDTSKL